MVISRAKQEQETGWDTELNELVSVAEYTEDQAREKVTRGYLCNGDCRPLLDWAGRGQTNSKNVMRIVAAMLDPQYRCGGIADFCYKFSIEPTRKRGGAGIIGSRLAGWLRQQATALNEGSDPGPAFWRLLTGAMAQGNPKWIWRQARVSYLVAAKIQAIKPTRGRRRDPELTMRDKALWQLIQRRTDADGYESAVTGVVAGVNAEIKRTGNGGCLDPITYRTARNAYDRHAGKIYRRR